MLSVSVLPGSRSRFLLCSSFAAFWLPSVVLAGAFESYAPASTFSLPENAGGLTVMADGRLLTVVGTAVYVETALGSRTYASHGELPGADFSSFGPGFLRVSPDGTRLAVGNSGGSSFVNYQVGVFDVDTLSGRWFDVNHFDAAWVDDSRLAITGSFFGSPGFVSVLDANSADAAQPSNPIVIDNIGGASGGIAFDAAGNLYTGNGYATTGPSATGAVKFFDFASWSSALASGLPVDFEAGGLPVVEILSASPLRFDAEGNLLVGGGDFSNSDVGYAGLVRGAALSAAVAVLGTVDPSDVDVVRRFDPDPLDDFNFYSVDYNGITGELYVRDGTTVYAFVVPEPAALLLLGVGGLALLRRRAAGSYSWRANLQAARAAGFSPEPHPQCRLAMKGRTRLHRFLPAPSGQMRIAQRFNAGIGDGPEVQSPVGTIERRSAVPPGLVEHGAGAFPALKRWAIVKRPSGTNPRRDVGKDQGFSPRETNRIQAAGFSLRETFGTRVLRHCARSYSPCKSFGHKDAGGTGTRPNSIAVLVCCMFVRVGHAEISNLKSQINSSQTDLSPSDSPFAVEWLEYDPAPGFWVQNSLFNQPDRALGRPFGGGILNANLDSLVSLGGFGGSIILAFDHTVADDPLNPYGLDAIVFGNAIWQMFDSPDPDPNRHWAECGTIEIAKDVNGDGLANDPWYLIPGSHIIDPPGQFAEQTWDADIGDPTYPPDEAFWIPAERSGQWQTEGFLLPLEVFGQPVVINPTADEDREGIFGYVDYTPTLLLGDLDADDVIDDASLLPGDFYTKPDDPFAIGISAGSGGGDAFDIAWAVDPATGLGAGLTGFDFVRIKTAVSFVHGVLGEYSPEIDAVADVAPDPFGDYDGDGDIDLSDAAGFFACYRSDNVEGSTCLRVDRERNGVIDQIDFAAFVARLTGPM